MRLLKIFQLVLMFGMIPLGMATSTHADVPRTFNVQGYLTDANGVPLPVKSYDVSFRLYTLAGNPVGTPSRWVDIVQVTPQANGYYNVLLGVNAKFADYHVDFSEQYKLGVTVGGDPEMTPRIELSSACYSMNVPDGIIGNSKFIAASVGTTTIASGAVLGGNIGSNTITASNIANNTITWNKLDPFASAPIFSIIAFYPSLRAGYSTSNLSSNWVPCNGQTISVTDPLNPTQNITVTLPNLNGEGRFLRGSNTSGVAQADELKSHNHQVIASWPSGTATEWHVVSNWTDPGQSPVNETAPGDGPSVTNTGGSETRPINISVVWIMKIK